MGDEANLSPLISPLVLDMSRRRLLIQKTAREKGGWGSPFGLASLSQGHEGDNNLLESSGYEAEKEREGGRRVWMG